MTVEQRSGGSQARDIQALFGGLQEVRAVGALAQRFTYENVDDIPAGVNPKQLDFLRDASNIGAFMRVKPDTAKLIAEYFTTEATYEDLAKQRGVHFSAVQKRIYTGLEKLHTILHQKQPSLASENTYPLGEIKKGKDKTQVFKTKRSMQRRKEAAKNRRIPQQSVEPTDVFVAEAPHSH